MESREIELQNVMDWGRVGTFMKVLCSPAAFVCVYVCAHLYIWRKARLSLGVSTLIPEKVKCKEWTWSGEVLVPGSPMEDLRV